MGTQLTAEQAKKQFQYLAHKNHFPAKNISLKKAKFRLKALDKQLQLPAMANNLDRAEFSKIALLMTAWAFSSTGRRALAPGLTTLVYFILRVRYIIRTKHKK